MIIFSDMDGTFLASDKGIPAEHEELLCKLDQLGIPFVPCTGRSQSSLPQAVLAHPCVTHAICVNGATICTINAQGKADVLKRNLLGHERARAIYQQVCADPHGIQLEGVNIHLFADGNIYCTRLDHARIDEFSLGDTHTAQFLKTSRTPLDCEFADILNKADNIERISLYVRATDELSAYANKLEQLDPTLSFVTSMGNNLEIADKDTSKGQALVWLCNELGHDIATSYAFGDSNNDVSMLRAAGCGCAMHNADAHTKQAAGVILPFTNDEGGISRYLLSIL